MPLDPSLARLTSIAYAKGYGSLFEKTPEEARTFLADLFKNFLKLPKPLATETTLDLPETDEHLRLRLYLPKSKSNIPPVFFWRGSAYIGGSIDDMDDRCTSIANSLETMVISIDYPCLPKAPFPLAFDRSLQTLCWLLQENDVFGYSFNSCYLWGESCGATITLSTAQRLPAALKAAIKQLVLFYPDLDNTGHYPSHQLYGQGYLADQSFRHWIYAHYLKDQSLRADPRLSPLLGSLADLPACLCITGECDPLRDELYAFHRLLEKQNIPVQTISYLGLTHGFLLYERLVPNAQRAFQDTLAILQKN